MKVIVEPVMEISGYSCEVLLSKLQYLLLSNAFMTEINFLFLHGCSSSKSHETLASSGYSSTKLAAYGTAHHGNRLIWLLRVRLPL